MIHQDSFTLVRMASKNRKHDVIEMEQKEFLDFKSMQKESPNKKEKKMILIVIKFTGFR